MTSAGRCQPQTAVQAPVVAGQTTLLGSSRIPVVAPLLVPLLVLVLVLLLLPLLLLLLLLPPLLPLLRRRWLPWRRLRLSRLRLWRRLICSP